MTTWTGNRVEEYHDDVIGDGLQGDDSASSVSHLFHVSFSLQCEEVRAQVPIGQTWRDREEEDGSQTD